MRSEHKEEMHPKEKAFYEALQQNHFGDALGIFGQLVTEGVDVDVDTLLYWVIDFNGDLPGLLRTKVDFLLKIGADPRRRFVSSRAQEVKDCFFGGGGAGPSSYCEVMELVKERRQEINSPELDDIQLHLEACFEVKQKVRTLSCGREGDLEFIKKLLSVERYLPQGQQDNQLLRDIVDGSIKNTYKTVFENAVKQSKVAIAQYISERFQLGHTPEEVAKQCALFQSIEELSKYRDSLVTENTGQATEAADALTEPCKVLLETATKFYFSSPQSSEEKITNLQAAFGGALLDCDKATTAIGHRKLIKPILANIILCALGVGLLAVGFKLVVALATKGTELTAGDVFLFGKTNREAKINAVKEHSKGLMDVKKESKEHKKR